MDLKFFSLVALLVLTYGLLACKKRARLVLKVSVSDANTTPVWREKSSDGRLFVLALRTGTALGTKLQKTCEDSMKKVSALAKDLAENGPAEWLGTWAAEFKAAAGVLKGRGTWQKTLYSTASARAIIGHLANADSTLSKPKAITGGLKQGIITDALVSAVDSNQNDAQISWIKVTYVDRGGKRVEDNIGEQPIGAEFSKEYPIISGKTMTVTARATQTGKTQALAHNLAYLRDAGEVLDSMLVNIAKKGTENEAAKQQLREALARVKHKAEQWHAEVSGRRTADAKVRLKLEILQDGVVIGGKEIEAKREVEATSMVYAVVGK